MSTAPKPSPAKKAKPSPPAGKRPGPAAKKDSAGPQAKAEAPTTAAKASRAAAALPEGDFDEPSALQEWLRDSPSWLASLVVHMAVLLILALVVLPADDNDDLGPVTVAPTEAEEELVDEILPDLQEEQLEIETDPTFEAPADTNLVSDMNMNTDALDTDAALAQVDAPEFDFGDPSAVTGLVTKAGTTSGKGLSGRGSASRKALIAAHGGNAASEQAVALALKWLAAHQMPDGGWNYDHRHAPSCRGQCGDPGMGDARMAATGMALLPFLGAGQTHKEGKYQKEVWGGLYFLMRNMKVSKEGGDLRDPGGRMYAHGLASIALTEAYGMTQDRTLAAPAQQAINFIVNAQDPVGGGWRYQPRTPGDTSVVGWQLMALKSAHMAYLHVPPNVVKGSIHYLDSVQTDSGAAYGYTTPGRGPATTAIGLLCRMYTGWNKDHPAIQRGMMAIAKAGPSNNLYRDYYAAQVMFQATGAKGEVWDKWNTARRDSLVNSQKRNGHEEGSWDPSGAGHSGRGGRLYETCMSCMILEVYYRHMPIYREQATQEEFPLD